jgi:3-dehydroquinate dehydratase I
MTEPKIAVAVTEDRLSALRTCEAAVDFWELRLDLIGPAWLQVARSVTKPWIACNRSPQEGGQGQSDEPARTKELLSALEAGAAIVDIELRSQMLSEIVPLIKSKAQCLISYHNFSETPPLRVLAEIVRLQLQAGADICKIITTAAWLEDNLTLLRLIKDNPEIRIVAFAMGPEGRLSRILSPLAGAYFTFASLEQGKESASGQIPVEEMREIYRLIK